MKKLLTLLALVLCTLSSMASNKIYYTSTDGKVVTPNNPNVFGANIVSNTYENGQGVITFDGEVTKIGDDAFYGCELTSILIPSSVTELGLDAFRYCEYLETINIPNSVTTIGICAFYHCINLKSITIGNSVTNIDAFAFWDCTNLISIIIPNSIVSMEHGVFNGCTNLSYVSLGNSLTKIGSGLFEDCNNLKKVYCYAENVPTVNGRDLGVKFDKLYVPVNSLEKYKQSTVWSASFNNILPITENGREELSTLLEQLLNGETASGDMQIIYNECLNILSDCANEEEAHQIIMGTCQPRLINAWIAGKKAQVKESKKGVSNDYVNEVYAEVMNNIAVAEAEGNIGAIRQAVTSGIGAITSARILYKHLGQGIVPAPLGAGMRMKVTTKSDKVYEFKTSDLKSTEYYRATE